MQCWTRWPKLIRIRMCYSHCFEDLVATRNHKITKSRKIHGITKSDTPLSWIASSRINVLGYICGLLRYKIKRNVAFSFDENIILWFSFTNSYEKLLRRIYLSTSKHNLQRRTTRRVCPKARVVLVACNIKRFLLRFKACDHKSI